MCLCFVSAVSACCLLLVFCFLWCFRLYLFVCLFVGLYLFDCICLFVFVRLHLFVYMFCICLMFVFFCLYLFICLFTLVFVCLHLSLSICFPACFVLLFDFYFHSLLRFSLDTEDLPEDPRVFFCFARTSSLPSTPPPLTSHAHLALLHCS